MADGKTRAVFFDRDGTIMHDVNYCSDPKDVHVFPVVADSLRKLKAREFKLIMVTNQSGIGRAYFTWEQYERVHAEVLRQLGEPLIDGEAIAPRLRYLLPALVEEELVVEAVGRLDPERAADLAR